MENEIVLHEKWVAKRKELLKAEKEFARMRDELSRRRRELPWECARKNYVFDGPGGRETLSGLFGGRSQLVIYHFAFGPDSEEGCPSCSLVVDNLDGNAAHLAARNVTLVVVSRAPIEKIEAFKKRMGWKVKWVSSLNNDFNRDHRVSFTTEEMPGGSINHNHDETSFPAEEAHGVSVFFKNEWGELFHTYSTYAHEAEMLTGVYAVLDLILKGPDEDDLPFPVAWVRHHDRCGNPPNTASAGCCAGAQALSCGESGLAFSPVE